MRKILSALLLAGAALVPHAAPAQTSDRRGPVEGRVERLEGEMRAVQRKVFPGGGGPYVQPENGPPPAQDIVPGSPASSPVADLSARVDALEGQLRTITNQVETDQHRLQLLEDRVRTVEARAVAAPPAATAPGDADGFAPATERPPQPRSTPLRTGADASVAHPADPARAARVAAVGRPDSGDVAEDTYLYGYRLWAAKLYPEAEAQFMAVTARFPTHKRASYAQNLLGRSYLEDGKPSLASLAFLDSYKKWPDGDRAPESLVYLAQALVTLNKPAAQVCKVYTEIERSYGAKVEADARLKASVAKGRAASSCS